MSAAEIIQFPEAGRVVKADTDDGWYKIANALSLKLCSVDMSQSEWKVFNAVKHSTFSYRKSMDWIAASQFEEMTGIAANKISEIKTRLVNRKILKADGRKVGINTVVSEWLVKPITPKQGYKQLPPNRVKITPKQDSITPKQGKKHPQAGVHNKKDNITQERIKDIVGKPDYAPICSQVISYLNEKAGKGFKNTPTNHKFITARLKDGHTAADLMTVIDRKVAEWMNDPKMNQYLRPSTLFNSEKFEGYLNSQAVPANQQSRQYQTPDFQNIDYTVGAEGFEHV